MTTRDATSAKHAPKKDARRRDLERMLEARRQELLDEVQEKMRDVRMAHSSGKTNAVLDSGETSEVDIRDDIEFALIQMKAETLSKIDEALVRLQEGAYGFCDHCGREIAQKRLQAMPFAVRCRECEDARETAAREERLFARRQQGVLSRLSDAPA